MRASKPKSTLKTRSFISHTPVGISVASYPPFPVPPCPQTNEPKATPGREFADRLSRWPAGEGAHIVAPARDGEVRGRDESRPHILAPASIRTKGDFPCRSDINKSRQTPRSRLKGLRCESMQWDGLSRSAGWQVRSPIFELKQRFVGICHSGRYKSCNGLAQSKGRQV
jgi:hypothetical protein